LCINRILIKTTFFFIISSMPLSSEEHLAQPLGRDELAQRVLALHPFKKVWAHELRAQKQIQEDAGLWERPSLRFSNLGDSMFGRDGTGSMTIGLEQKIPIGKKYSLSRELAQLSTSLKVESIRLRQLDMAKMAEEIWLELAFLNEKEKQIEDILDLNRQLSEFLETKSKLGEVSPLEVSEVNLELAALQSESLKLIEEKSNAMGKLRELLGIKSHDIIEIDTSSLFKVEALDALSSSLSRHPQVILSNHQVEQRQLELSSMKASRFDHFNLEVEWEEEKEVGPLGSEREGNLGIAFSMTLPLRSESPGAVEAAGTTIEEAKEARTVLLYQLEKHGERLLRRHQQLKTQLELLDRQVLVTNEQSIKLHQKAYQEGRIDQSRLIRSQEKALNHRMRRLQVLKDLAHVGSQWRELTSAHLPSNTRGDHR
jgi:outer membrane protein TolC